MNEAREPVLRWHAENAWINKIEGPTLQGRRQRGGDGVGRARARGPDASRSERDTADRDGHAAYVDPGRLLRAGRRRRAARRAAAHRHRRLRRHRAARPAATARCRSSRGGSSSRYFGDFTGTGYLAYARARILRERRPRAAGSCASPRRRRRPPTRRCGEPAPLAAPPKPAHDAWRVEASSPGVWGNDLDDRGAGDAQARRRWPTRRRRRPTTPSCARSPASTRARTCAWSTDPASPAFRAVAAVDATRRRAVLDQSDAAQRAATTSAPLAGFDPNRPLVIESVEYTLLVRELGRLIAVYQRSLARARRIRGTDPTCSRRSLSTRGPERRRAARSVRAPAPERAMTQPSSAAAGRRRERATSTLAPLVAVDADAVRARCALAAADGLAALAVRDFIGEPCERVRRRRGASA